MRPSSRNSSRIPFEVFEQPSIAGGLRETLGQPAFDVFDKLEVVL